MKIKAKRFAYRLSATSGLAALLVCHASAQEFSLNGERLSSLEEPLATEIGDVTFTFSGLLDGSIDFDLGDSDEDDLGGGLIGNFETTATTQLFNRWNVGIAYFGQYETAFEGDDYTDNIAAFIGGSWGTLVGGEVSNVVREETRRPRGVGNADLLFDNALGSTDDWATGYVGQFGPSRLSGIVDEDGDFDLGFTWERPYGAAGYQYGLRYTDGEFLAADELTSFDTKAVTGTFGYIFGRTHLSAGLGVERLESELLEADRWYSTAGWQHQFGEYTASAEAHYGEVEGQSENAAAVGLSYALSRGLSLNLGVNYSDAQIALDGVPLLAEDETQALISLRFSF